MADSPTGREPPTAHEQWVLLHGGQGGTSLEYQTYTSAYLFDALVSGLVGGATGGGNMSSAFYKGMAEHSPANSFLGERLDSSRR